MNIMQIEFVNRESISLIGNQQTTIYEYLQQNHVNHQS